MSPSLNRSAVQTGGGGSGGGGERTTTGVVMEISLGLILLIVGLGTLQLIAGVLIGRCWPLRDRQAARIREAAHLEQLARQLDSLTGSVHEDVDQHQARLREADQELRALDAPEDRQLADLALKTAAGIMRHNERLQHRLSDAEKQLQRQSQQIQMHLAAALTDPLTGLPNRRAFDDELKQYVGQWQANRRGFCLLAIDVDHFKTLNDRFGHPVGDRALCLLGEVLRDTLAGWGATSRIGGEELTVILGCSHLEDAKRLAEKARRAVAAAVIDPQLPEAHLTVSIGLAMIQPGETPAAIAKRADQALYAAKRAGRNCTYWHDGRACHRVASNDTVDHGSPPPEAAELDALCQDLRVRLSQVAVGHAEA